MSEPTSLSKALLTSPAVQTRSRSSGNTDQVEAKPTKGGRNGGLRLSSALSTGSAGMGAPIQLTPKGASQAVKKEKKDHLKPKKAARLDDKIIPRSKLDSGGPGNTSSEDEDVASAGKENEGRKRKMKNRKEIDMAEGLKKEEGLTSKDAMRAMENRRKEAARGCKQPATETFGVPMDFIKGKSAASQSSQPAEESGDKVAAIIEGGGGAGEGNPASALIEAAGGEEGEGDASVLDAQNDVVDERSEETMEAMDGKASEGNQEDVRRMDGGSGGADEVAVERQDGREVDTTRASSPSLFGDDDNDEQEERQEPASRQSHIHTAALTTMEDLATQMEREEEEEEQGEDGGELSFFDEDNVRRKGKKQLLAERSLDSMEREVREPSPEDDEERDISSAALRRKVAEKQSASSAAMRKDESETTRALRDAIVMKVDIHMAAKMKHYRFDINEVDIYERHEVKIEAVDNFVKLFKRGTMTQSGQTLIGWFNKEDRTVVIVDGRHRLAAMRKIYREETHNMTEEEKEAYPKVGVSVDVVIHSLLAAMLKKMSKDSVKKTASAFEKVIQLRSVLDDLGMLRNDALTDELRMSVLKERISDEYPKSHVKAACYPEAVIEYIRENMGGEFTDHSKTLTAYHTAALVNEDNAMEALKMLERASTQAEADAAFEVLEDMKCSISQYLMSAKFDANGAHRVERSVFKSKDSYATIRRLTTGNNRMSGTTKNKGDPKLLLMACERCLPPVTFTDPVIDWTSEILETKSTLYIYDEQSFELEVKNIAKLVLRKERKMNFLITGADPDYIKQKMQSTMKILITSTAPPPRTPSSSQSASSTPTSSDQRLQQRPPIDTTHVRVGVASVSVDSAPFTRPMMSTQGVESHTCTVVNAVLMRAAINKFVDQRELTTFMGDMKITGKITPTCLRLLTFDPETQLSNTENSPIFFHATTTEAIAVAARCAAYRITTLSTTDDGAKDEIVEKQKMLTDEDWKASYESAYKTIFTKDGKPAPPTKGSRNKVSKLKKAVSSGLVSF